MIRSPRTGALIVLFFLCCAAYYLLAFRGTGPLELARAEMLLADHLGSRTNRVDTIAPDGELAQVPPAILTGITAIACPQTARSPGSVQGRWGGFFRSYASARYDCLFTAEAPEGVRHFLAATATLSTDPAPNVQGTTEGAGLFLLTEPQIRALMRRYSRTTEPYDPQHQTALWELFADHDIIVPSNPAQSDAVSSGFSDALRQMTSD